MLAKKFKLVNSKIVILLVILILGVFLRFYHLGNNSFVADEFLDINATYGYHKLGIWKAWDFNLEQAAERINDPSDSRAWIYRIQVAKLFQFFPPTEAVARSVSALWGVFSIILIYFVTTYFIRGSREESFPEFIKKAVRKPSRAGLLSAFLLAISVASLIFSRRLRMYSMFFPVYLSFSWACFMFLESKYKKKYKIGLFNIAKKVYQKLEINLVYLAPVILLGLLSLHLHLLTVNIILVVLVYSVLMIFVKVETQSAIQTDKNLASLRKKYISLTSLIILTILSFFIFFPNKLQMLEFFNNHYSYIEKVLVDYSHPLLAILLFSLGIYYLCKTKKLTKEATWLAVSFLVPFLAAIFLWQRNVGPQYIFFAQSFEIILIAIGIEGLAQFFSKKLTNLPKKFKPSYVYILTIIFSLLIVPNYFYFFEENNIYRQNSRSEAPRYRQIFHYVKTHKNKEDVIITRDFRNYYLSGEKIKIYDFGGELSEENLSEERVKEIISNHPGGWIVLSDNDESYVSKKAKKYIESNLEKINDIQVRGNVSVYRW